MQNRSWNPFANNGNTSCRQQKATQRIVLILWYQYNHFILNPQSISSIYQIKGKVFILCQYTTIKYGVIHSLTW